MLKGVAGRRRGARKRRRPRVTREPRRLNQPPSAARARAPMAHTGGTRSGLPVLKSKNTMFATNLTLGAHCAVLHQCNTAQCPPRALLGLIPAHGTDATANSSNRDLCCDISNTFIAPDTHSVTSAGTTDNWRSIKRAIRYVEPTNRKTEVPYTRLDNWLLASLLFCAPHLSFSLGAIALGAEGLIRRAS